MWAGQSCLCRSAGSYPGAVQTPVCKRSVNLCKERKTWRICHHKKQRGEEDKERVSPTGVEMSASPCNKFYWQQRKILIKRNTVQKIPYRITRYSFLIQYFFISIINIIPSGRIVFPRRKKMLEAVLQIRDPIPYLDFSIPDADPDRDLQHWTDKEFIIFFNPKNLY